MNEVDSRLKAVKATMEENRVNGLLFTDPFNIYYLTGFEGSSAHALVCNRRQYLILDSRYENQVKQKTKEFEVIIAQGEGTILNLLIINGVTHLGFEAEHLTFEQYDFFSRYYKNVSLIPIMRLLKKQRMIKTHEELLLIKKASEIAENAFKNLISILKVGMSERQAAIELERIMMSNGADSLAFRTIVASGDRSALPHGVASDKIIKCGDILTLDYGCIYNGYCSDITRTVIMGKPTKEQDELYRIVKTAQELAISKVRAGAMAKDVDFAARSYIYDNGYGDKFKHGSGHGIGLEVHECPTLAQNSEEILDENTVITVEPGIYFEAYGGIRLEDMIIVTEDGHERLTMAPEYLIGIY